MGIKSITQCQLAKIKTLQRGLKYRHILPYVDIDGWLSVNEAIELYNLTAALPTSHPVVLEIGSWLGKSSFILAKAIQNKNHPKLYCIDPFNGNGDVVSKPVFAQRIRLMNESPEERFIYNMRKTNVLDIITILKGYSYEFAGSFPEKIDLLFIDGNHDYEAVLKDFIDWSSFLKPDGIIVFHDVTTKQDCQGPWLVINRYIQNNPHWQDLKLVDTIFSAKKTS